MSKKTNQLSGFVAILLVLAHIRGIQAGAVTPYNMTMLEDDSNAYIQKFGELCLEQGSWTIMATLEFPDFINNLETVTKDVDMIIRACKQIYDFSNSTCTDFASKINVRLQQLNRTHNTILHLLEPMEVGKNRIKRGFFNIIGSASKLLFGSATEEDVQDIKRKFEIVDIEHKRSEELMKIHTSLIKSTLAEINETRFELNTIMNKMKEITAGLNVLQGQLLHLQIVEHLNNAENLLQIELENLEHDQNQLLLVIHSAIAGRCHPLLLAPYKLEQEILNIDARLPENTRLPSLTIAEMYKLANTLIISNAKRITAFVRLPLCEKRKFFMNKILPLPFSTNNSSKIIVIDYQFIATDTTQEFYALLNAEQVCCDSSSPLEPLILNRSQIKLERCII